MTATAQKRTRALRNGVLRRMQESADHQRNSAVVPRIADTADRHLRVDRAGDKAVLLRELVKVCDRGGSHLLLCLESNTGLEDYFADPAPALGQPAKFEAHLTISRLGGRPSSNRRDQLVMNLALTWTTPPRSCRALATATGLALASWFTASFPAALPLFLVVCRALRRFELSQLVVRSITAFRPDI
jgi:hypothetical protein